VGASVTRPFVNILEVAVPSNQKVATVDVASSL
jgi:hypothetical protein